MVPFDDTITHKALFINDIIHVKGILDLNPSVYDHNFWPDPLPHIIIIVINIIICDIEI